MDLTDLQNAIQASYDKIMKKLDAIIAMQREMNRKLRRDLNKIRREKAQRS